jgi:hypothetical protein
MNYSSGILQGLQLPLFPTVAPYPIQNFRLKEKNPPRYRKSLTKRVLGGDEDEPKKIPAQGWLKWKPVIRKRKNSADWQTDQLWFYWEEKGKKRSRYVPRRKEDEVIEMVRGLKRPIQETLKLLEKRK